MKNKSKLTPQCMRNFNTPCKKSGLGVRRLQNAARLADKTVGDIVEAATIATQMGYSPKKLVLAMTR